MTMLRRAALAALLTGLMSAGAAVFALAPAQAPTATSAPTDGQVHELQQQVETLQQQLDQLKAAPDAAARQQLMQQHWQSMQSYMGQMHDRWGMGYPWMMGHPWSMMGPGMMGGGGSWPAPQGVTPDQYSQQMRDYTQRMQEQMNKIAQTTDPQERQSLMQEQWREMYQGIQTMRGRGWMWGGGMMGGGMMGSGPPPSSSPLPDAKSAGAKLVSTYCVQCHAAPAPSLHTAKEWSSVTQRMHIHMDSRWQSINTPTEQEMNSIVAYMQKHARQ
jgi:hypothetical protein